jgi:uncharacterized protein
VQSISANGGKHLARLMLIPEIMVAIEDLPGPPVGVASGLSCGPLHPDIHLFETQLGPHLFLVNGSQVYGLGADELRHLRHLEDEAPDRMETELKKFGLHSSAFIDDTPITSPPIRALSLAVAQVCNLGCTYCYAQQGDFGGASKQMPATIALAAVDRLFADATPTERVNLAFLGGEPLVARDVIRAATERAARLSEVRRIPVGFSITTNGTLITPDDADFFEQHGFAVSVSLDGVGETHDGQRPFKSGRGSYARILANIEPLLKRQNRMQVSARVTVTPRNLELPRTLGELVALGFHSVGFSPMLSAPSGRDEMNGASLAIMLEQMIACGREFEDRMDAGERFPFANMVNAMKELHRGTHRPYPCGAGAGYLGVSADGELSACHRFVNDVAGQIGDLATGVDSARQNRWLGDRHVHRQEPCQACWARYLCGGGCHHEVIHRGRPACEYIRGWLHYCLQAYVRLLQRRPDYFAAGNRQTS